MSINVIIPAGQQKAYDRMHYAPAVRHGELIFCSGVIGDGERAEDEFRDAWIKVGAVLAEAGVGYSDIIDSTIYLVDIATHTMTMARVKDEFITPPYPASTWIGVSALVRPGARAEIKVTARLPS
jgi:enamine deaminase RidA (YjgF/YER057c/UK114 family)